MQTKGRVNKKHVIFSKAYESSTKKYWFVEVPLLYNQKVTAVIHSVDTAYDEQTHIKIRKATLPRVVFFRNKGTGSTGQYVLHYIPDPEYLNRFGQDISKNQLDKIDKNFTGYIRYSDWEGKPLKSLRIKKGRVLYNLNSYNCTDFAIAVASKGGLSLPATTRQENLMGGLLKFNGRNPGDLGQDIRNMSLQSGATRNTSKTNSPNKSGNCQ